jgi:hypothetical protein
MAVVGGRGGGPPDPHPPLAMPLRLLAPTLPIAPFEGLPSPQK